MLSTPRVVTDPADKYARRAIDGARRRRVYLFRHGAVDYINPDGSWVADPDAVILNAKGQAQAQAMQALCADVVLDKAVCSGLLRTRQTGEAILGKRKIALEIAAGFEEIRPAKPTANTDGEPDYDVFADIAFSHWRAQEFSATFLGGERYHDFYARVTESIDELLAEPDWNNVAVFAHGGTNAAILGWVSGLGLAGFGLFDQATCCLNVIDLDVDEEGRILRRYLRGVNITADDPAKHERDASDMELLAKRLMQMRADG